MVLNSVFLAAFVAYAGSAFAAAEAPAPAPASIPLTTFFAAPQFAGAVLSPDGANVALLVRGPEGNIVLATKPTAGGPARILAGLRDMDIEGIHWVNNRRLVFSGLRRDARDTNRAAGPGLHAINIDGSKRIHLIAHGWIGGNDRTLPPNTHFLSTVRDDKSNDVYVTRYKIFNEDFEGYTVMRMDTESGNLTRVDVPTEIRSVLVDPEGALRVATARKDGLDHILYNDAKAGAWRDLGGELPTSAEAMTPVLVTRSGELYVSSYHGRETRGLYRYDLAAGKLDAEPVVKLQNYDFDGKLILAPDGDTVLGARYETSESITTWFDDGMKQLQARVDAALPSTINELSLPRDVIGDCVLVYSYSDVEPGFWQLYQRSTGSFTKLGTRMPAINPLHMAGMKMVRYKARDGREIPAYLTMPKGAPAKPPMVVLVHGGPWVRGGHLHWDRAVQFLASRGYAVLQPEYRGSMGFGRAHFEAGWQQWGRAMQDDVADGAKWAIGQGFADASRICIAGASYGGYATLMGLVNDPELFRCGIDWAYGGKDRTVPIEHGKRFYAAVKKTNTKAEWAEYEEEGHGWFYDRTNLDFWARVERFLAQNIGH